MKVWPKRAQTPFQNVLPPFQTFMVLAKPESPQTKNSKEGIEDGSILKWKHLHWMQAVYKAPFTWRSAQTTALNINQSMPHATTFILIFHSKILVNKGSASTACRQRWQCLFAQLLGAPGILGFSQTVQIPPVHIPRFGLVNPNVGTRWRRGTTGIADLPVAGARPANKSIDPLWDPPSPR